MIADHKGDREYWQLIWDKFKIGDRGAFETIYNEFIDSLFAYGSKITTNKSMLEDAIQDVFIDIYTYGKGLRKPEFLEFYLIKTLKNILIRKLKEDNLFTRKEDSVTMFDLEFQIEEMDEKNIQEKRFQLLQDEIKNLDAKKRELLFLKFNSGLTNVEIAKLLDIKPETVKKQVQRLVKYFRKKFESTLFELFLLCYKK